jgi:hypothetical protein
MMAVGALHLALGVGGVVWARKQDDATPPIGGDA